MRFTVMFRNGHVIFRDRVGLIRVRDLNPSHRCPGWPCLTLSEAFKFADVPF